MVSRRTGRGILSGKTDPRVEHSRRALHGALTALVPEKDYDEIAVREILDRASVSRSTFYAHFDCKDELLASGIERMVTSPGADPLTSFSLPILEHHDRHRRTGTMSGRTRALLHEQLRALIARRIRDHAKRSTRKDGVTLALSPELRSQFVASTFIVVLDWWLDTRSPLSPLEVHQLFCSLVRNAGPAGADGRVKRAAV
jgi:AcrR family transcriptional regulator